MLYIINTVIGNKITVNSKININRRKQNHLDPHKQLNFIIIEHLEHIQGPARC